MQTETTYPAPASPIDELIRMVEAALREQSKSGDRSRRSEV